MPAKKERFLVRNVIVSKMGSCNSNYCFVDGTIKDGIGYAFIDDT